MAREDSPWRGAVLSSRRYATCSPLHQALGTTGMSRPVEHHQPGKRLLAMDLGWIVAIVFLVLWMLGFLAFDVTTGFIHLLLVVAVCAVVFRLVTGRRSA